jgi:hypothetical protein
VLTSSATLHLTASVGSVSVIIGSVERLARPRLLDDGALASWSVASTSAPFLAGRRFQRTVGLVLVYPRILVLIAVCLSCAVLLALGGVSPGVDALAASVIAATYVLLSMRSRFGGDGADQMSLVTFAALALAFGIGYQQADVLVLWFLTAQACLAYFTAGVAKLVSSSWRSGTALPEILATHAYGHPWGAKILSRRPHVSQSLCWSVILLECAFPLVLLGIDRLTYGLLVGGALFHLGTAILMRLNTFLWAFVATYPAILFCAGVGTW